MTLITTQKFSYLLALLLLSQVYSASATTLTWTGTLDDDWNNTLNWSPTQIPSAADSVIIMGNVNVTIYSGANMACYYLSVGSSDDLEIEAGAKLTISNAKDADAIIAIGRITNKGTIIIDGCDTGITCTNRFINDGEIIISNLSDIAITTLTAGKFVNGGKIYIDNVSYGLKNSGSFTNKDYYISANSRVRDINQRGTLTNEDCAEMISAGFSNTSTSTTTNEGTMTWVDNEVTLHSAGTFTNDGIIADHIGTNSTTLGYISPSSVLLTSPLGSVNIGDQVIGLIAASFTKVISDSIFTDYNLTHSAGAYSRFFKRWKVNSGAYEKDTFYVALKVSSSCIDTVAFYIKEPVLDCSDDNIFTGATSSLWSIAANWSLSHVPTECETVVISGHNVDIPASYEAECRTLLIIGDLDTLDIGTGATLNISRGTQGIVADDHCTIVNDGTISISKFHGQGIFASEMHIINSGLIDIVNAEKSAIYIDSGLIDNSGTIAITNSLQNGIELNDGSLLNKGTLEITKSGKKGLDLSGANFNNSGSITIDETSDIGIRLLERHLYNSGDINIKNTEGISFYISDTLDNYGDIIITDGSQLSLFLDGYLSNYGTIDISNLDKIALSVSFASEFALKENNRATKSSRTSQLLNYGHINLKGSASDLIYNDGIIYNDSCGTVSLNGGMTNPEIINNYGIWYQDYIGQNSTSGTFNNHGVVNDLQGSFTDCVAASGCYTTTGLRFGSVIGDTAFVRTSYSDILEETSTTMIVDSVWYLDPEFSEEAGSYEASTNSYTPTANSLEYQNFFFSVSIGTSGCVDTIMINFKNIVMSAACDSINALTTKSITSDWTSSRFWDLKRAPVDCDDVYVDDSSINLEIMGGDTAVCNTFTLINGVFTVDSSAVMVIQE